MAKAWIEYEATNELHRVYDADPAMESARWDYWWEFYFVTKSGERIG